MLTIGKGLSRTSDSTISGASTPAHDPASHSRWVRGTPLGSASVPEVQQIVIASFGSFRPSCRYAVTAARSSSLASAAVTTTTPGGVAATSSDAAYRM